MGKPRDGRHRDLFRPPLDQIVNPEHPLVRLGGQIDWEFIEQRFGAVYGAGPGHPPLPSRLVAGLFILKHMTACRTRRCARAGSRTPITSISAANSASATSCRSTARP